jgi:hypothetical protein
MFSRLETQIDDPAERLEAIAEANDAAKEHSTAIGATLLQDWSSSPGPRCSASRCGVRQQPADRVAAGAQPGGVQRARAADSAVLPGRRGRLMYPLGPIFHGSGLNITVMSLNGKLDVG